MTILPSEQGDVLRQREKLARAVRGDDDVGVLVAEHAAGGQAQRHVPDAKIGGRVVHRRGVAHHAPARECSGVHMPLSSTRFICSSQMRGKSAGRAATMREFPAAGSIPRAKISRPV